MTRISLALGSGGAKGLAHITMLEVFDELGVRPHRIAGSSIGAIFGAMYASGTSAQQIRTYVDAMIINKGDRLGDILVKKDLGRWMELVDLRRNGLAKGDNLRTLVNDGVIAKDFDGLQIPLRIVAADFWNREEVVLERGELGAAVRASISLPGLFAPASIDGRVLVDGGTVNPLPYDIWQDECDLTVAIDVSGSRTAGRTRTPGFLDSIFNAYQIMQSSILNEKIKHLPPDILIRPDIANVRVFEFFKARQVYRQAAPAKDHLKRELERLLDQDTAA